MTAFQKTARITRRLARPRLVEGILRLMSVNRSRQGLRRLDDHILRDIGLTREEAEAEASRAPWDAPLHWRG